MRSRKQVYVAHLVVQVEYQSDYLDAPGEYEIREKLTGSLLDHRIDNTGTTQYRTQISAVIVDRISTVTIR